ncbi:hypothetical protein [Priestia megaterium]|uniref:hypothetical protein n=1 Tax=Priestia megaterium TaxID=1404 RepID=UPI000BF86116|nr:hypothetical protein [Priestia megaterium]PFR88879.1 hypothetical protein COK39_25550 [Priestia megaterium]
MYRPTVRYSEVYRQYVDELFRLTSLDRNQIIRCGLFSSVQNPIFLDIMNQHKRSDVPLPSPLWTVRDHHVWMEQDPEIKGGGERRHDVYQRKESIEEPSGILRTSTVNGGLSTLILPSSQTETQNRRESSVTGRTRTVPTIQLSNNRGIRLDFR